MVLARMVLIFRIGPTYNPNRTDVKFAARFLSGFSAGQVTTALEHMPVAIVRGPRPHDDTMAGPWRHDLIDAQTLS